MKDFISQSVEFWTEAELNLLPVGEWDWLEMKSAAWVKHGWEQNLSPYISAWANYDGGYMVIGAENPTTDKALAFGGIDLAGQPKFMDRLDMLIPNLVDPPITSFTTKAIQLPSGLFVIVIRIPESESAPHQAKDKKYYARRGRHLDALGHRAILDIVNRRRHPKIKTRLRVSHLRGEGRLTWRLVNTSDVLAIHVKSVIHFPTMYKGRVVMFEESPRNSLTTNDTSSYWAIRILNGDSPLFPMGDMTFHLSFSYTGGINPPLPPSIENITVTTYADSMPPFVETFSIEEVFG